MNHIEFATNVLGKIVLNLYSHFSFSPKLSNFHMSNSTYCHRACINI